MPPALTSAQIEVLRRVRDGVPLWHGALHVERLRDEVALLRSLELVERDADAGYRLTDVGRTWLLNHAGS